MKRAHIEVVCGASGSGKTAYVLGRLRAHARAWVWDMKAEYGREKGWRTIERPADLIRAAREGWPRVAFAGTSPAQFDLWCRAAHIAAGLHAGLALVAEELADVTTPGKAPLAWGIIVRRGRDRDMHVWAVTQRPSETDKTVLGNRTLLRIGRTPAAQDAEYLSKQLGGKVTAAELQRLPDYAAIVQDERGDVRRIPPIRKRA